MLVKVSGLTAIWLNKNRVVRKYQGGTEKAKGSEKSIALPASFWPLDKQPADVGGVYSVEITVLWIQIFMLWSKTYK
jgi:hypothetical protein